MASNIIVV